MAEGKQNINDFLTRISTSKQDFNGFWKKFLVIKEGKEIFDTVHTAAYEAKDNCFGLWLSWRTWRINYWGVLQWFRTTNYEKCGCVRLKL